MAISPKTRQDLHFLSSLEATQFSVAFEGDNLKKVNKRSVACNFLSWFIYLITFTLIPRNRELDRITRSILKEIQNDLVQATGSEKSLAEKALQNLTIVINDNGGSDGNAVKKMLLTIGKINALPTVQLLSANQTTIQEDKRLQQVLQELLQHPPNDKKGAEKIAELLPTLQGWSFLSEEELEELGKGLNGLDPSFLKENLSTLLLELIVKNSLLRSNLTNIFCIMRAMIYQTFDKDQFMAFAQGFKEKQKGSKEIDSRQVGELILRLPQIAPFLQQHLSPDELRGFLENVCQLVVIHCADDSQETVKIFKQALLLLNTFGPDYRQTILQELCKVKPVILLVEIIHSTLPGDNAIESLLTFNPPKKSDPYDSFFDQFIDNLEIGEYPTIAPYVFKHASLKRKEIFVKHLSPYLIARFLEHIPTQLIVDLDDQTIIAVVKEIIKSQRNKSNVAQLEALAQAMKSDRLYKLVTLIDERDFWISLLPLCDVKTQMLFLSKINSSENSQRKSLFVRKKSKSRAFKSL